MKEELNIEDIERELRSLRPVMPSSAVKRQVAVDLPIDAHRVRVVASIQRRSDRTRQLSWVMAAAVLVAFTCWVAWRGDGNRAIPAIDVSGGRGHIAGIEHVAEPLNKNSGPAAAETNVYYPPTWLSLAEAFAQETELNTEVVASEAASWLPPLPPFRNTQAPVFAFAGIEP